jgi:TIR domain
VHGERCVTFDKDLDYGGGLTTNRRGGRMAHEAFVSYSHHDKPQADAVCATLESKGIRCWIAPRDVIPGQEWGAAIVDAIRSSRVMVLVFSSHANSSPQIRREVQLAVSAETVLIPFRIEDVAPAQSLEYFLGTPHWLDALTPPLEAHLERLTAAVMSFLALGESDGSPAGTATTPEDNSATAADLTQTTSPRGGPPRTEGLEPIPESTGAGGLTRPERAFTVAEESDGAAAKKDPATGIVSRPASVPPTETTPTEQMPLHLPLSRRSKIALAVVASSVVVAVVVGIILEGRSSSGGTTTSPASTSTTKSETAPEAQLLAAIPPDLHCSTTGGRVGLAALAEVGCTADGLSHLVFDLFPDRTTLDAAFDSSSSTSNSVPCPGRGPSPQSWARPSNPTQAEGQVKCENRRELGSPPEPQVVWTINSPQVYGCARGGSIEQLYQWWAARYQ